MSHRLIIILGPTASGKSSLGVTLAKQFRGVVISADSRQVYRRMNLGTGKITKREMRGVPHCLLDVASQRSQYSVARYVRDVRRVVKTIPKTTPIFLVGGSPFYIDALTKPNSYSPIPPNPKLRRRLANMNTAPLLARLRKLDPIRAATIDPANRRRLIRAIEIASAKHRPEAITLPVFSVLKLGIAIPTSRLHRNIDRRVDTRMRQGMLREVERLHRHGLSWIKLDNFGLEYRFLSRYLREKISRVEMNQQLKSAIKNFAKRQMTWWKRDRDIQWITTATQAQRLTQRFLQ